MYPLFRYDAPLQNPELIVRRLVDAARRNGQNAPEAAHTVLTAIRTLLKNVLQLDDQFVYSDRYAKPAIALRHYVNPVRHKFWTSLFT